jgi:hypothetical protein
MFKQITLRYLIPTALIAGVIIACGEDAADAQAPAEPVSQKVVVMNTSGEAWTGMTVLVDGAPACNVAELAPGGSVTIHDGACETMAPAAEAPEAPPAPAPAPAPAAAPAPAPNPAPAAAPAATGGALQATTTVSAGIGPARRIGIVNNNSFDWSKCSVTLNGEWSYHMPSLSAGEHEGIMGQRFKDPSGDIMTKNHQIHSVAVKCAEGSGTFTPQ